MNIENIKFRGKRIDNGELVCGYLIRDVAENNHPRIVIDREYSSGVNFVAVAPRVIANTVGQYTGLKDRNGVEIYVGDIVREKSVHWRNPDKVETEIYAVKCDYLGSLHLVRPIPGGERTTLLNRSSWVEVLGNIYDNPELLEVIE